MREPAFWHRRGSVFSAALWPLSKIYGEIAAFRMTRDGVEAGVPVICVGNFHVGGAGKTPTVLALVEMLRGLGETPVVLSRGYGGRLKGPVLVDPARHSAADVGDEPLMMAALTPVVVSRDRVVGAVLARARGASAIVMDDGFQNPSLVKHLSLVVIDASRGVGNGFVFPAGPLRAPLDAQFARTDALVVIGEGEAADSVIARTDVPVFSARLVPDSASVAALAGKRVLAFAGIGDPAKFFRTLQMAGIEIAAQRAFGDHHAYSADEVSSLRAEAAANSLTLVTTQKDCARLGAQAKGMVSFGVALAYDDAAHVSKFVSKHIERARMARLAGR
jgi:tetraacyldisaccharide 4'-kinase